MPPIFKFLSLGLLVALFLSPRHATAAYFDDEPEISTHPIGSPYYRHLAQETGIDLRELVKYEKRGFGRSEILILIAISSATGKPLKEYGQRRIKDNVPLRDLAKEANLDYEVLLTKAREVKQRIEFLGSDALPPPLFEVATSTPSAKKKKKEKKEKKPKEEAPPEKSSHGKSELD